MNTYLLVQNIFVSNLRQWGWSTSKISDQVSTLPLITPYTKSTDLLPFASKQLSGKVMCHLENIQLYHFSGTYFRHYGLALNGLDHQEEIHKYFSNAKASPNRRGTYLAHFAWLRAWQSSWYLNSCSGMTLLTASFSFCRGSLKRSSWEKKQGFFKHIYKTYFARRSSKYKIYVLDIDYIFEILTYLNANISSTTLSFHNAYWYKIRTTR